MQMNFNSHYIVKKELKTQNTVLKDKDEFQFTLYTSDQNHNTKQNSLR